MTHLTDPTQTYPRVGFEPDPLDQPGLTTDIEPTPDHGEHSYVGSERLTGRSALITGGESGIGRATAIAFAREGADIAIVYLPEEQADAEETQRWVEDADQRAVLIPVDLTEQSAVHDVVRRVIRELGGIDVLVLNAGYQRKRDALDFDTDEFDRVLKTNVYAQFWLTQAALKHLQPGSSIIVTSSIQAEHPSPDLIDYAMTKAAQVAFVRASAELLGDRGIRVNAVAPGPIWTPLIPATGWHEKVERFGSDTPLGRPGQPAEVAPAFVYLASDDASYVSGSVLAVTGGKSF